MILTDKAKEDFNKWNYDNDFGYIDHEPTSLVVHFEDLDENLRNTIIVEWFDSIGLWEREFYEVYIESTPTTEFKQIIEKTIVNLNKKYNEGIFHK